MYWEDRQLDTNEPVAGKAVGAGQYLHLCTATAVHTLRRIISQRKRSGTKTA